MPPHESTLRGLGYVPPGRVVTGVMVTLGAIWLMFAAALNWAHAGDDLFYMFCGNTERILHGEVWRLFTAPLMHEARENVSHIVFAELGFFFLAPSLEERWGGARMLRFLVLSGLLAYGLQMLLAIVLPVSISQRLVPNYWFGSGPIIGAIAIAWALSHRGQTVRLFFMLPVSSTGLVISVVALSLLMLIAGVIGSDGAIAPFGGMLAGWLLGGGTPSPLRRAYLKLRLAQLDHEASRRSRSSAQRRKDSPLRVIEGGRGRGSSHDDDGGPGGRILH